MLLYGSYYLRKYYHNLWNVRSLYNVTILTIMQDKHKLFHTTEQEVSKLLSTAEKWNKQKLEKEMVMKI